MNLKNISILFIVLLLFGCVSKEEQIAELKTEAEEHLDNGELDEAIALYEEVLSIEEDPALKKELKEIEIEKKSVEGVEKFLDDLYELQKNRTRSGISVSITDMEFIVKDLEAIFKDFDRLDDSKDTEIAELIRDIKADSNRYMLDLYLEHNLFEDSGMAEGLGELNIGLKQQNTLLVAHVRNVINDTIDSILENEIPEKYL